MTVQELWPIGASQGGSHPLHHRELSALLCGPGLDSASVSLLDGVTTTSEEMAFSTFKWTGAGLLLIPHYCMSGSELIIGGKSEFAEPEV